MGHNQSKYKIYQKIETRYVLSGMEWFTTSFRLDNLVITLLLIRFFFTRNWILRNVLFAVGEHREGSLEIDRTLRDLPLEQSSTSGGLVKRPTHAEVDDVGHGSDRVISDVRRMPSRRAAVGQSFGDRKRSSRADAPA